MKNIDEIRADFPILQREVYNKKLVYFDNGATTQKPISVINTLTDVYKHLRSTEEIENCLKECGMVDISAVYAGNGVEARAVKPVKN